MKFLLEKDDGRRGRRRKSSFNFKKKEDFSTRRLGTGLVTRSSTNILRSFLVPLGGTAPDRSGISFHLLFLSLENKLPKPETEHRLEFEVRG